IDRVIAAGARRILAAPVLLFPAGHAKHDMPQEVSTARRRYPSLEIVEVPYLGSDEALLDLVADRAAEAQVGRTAAPGDTALLLVGRGATDPEANAELCRIARLLWERRLFREVEVSFVSLAPPDVPAGIDRCVRLGARRVIVLPYFLNTGILVKRIADQVAAARSAYSGVDLIVGRHFGVDDRLVGLLARRIEVALAAPAWPASGDPAEDPTADGPTLARFALPTDRIEAVSLERIEALLRSAGRSPLDRWADADRLMAKRLIYAAGDPAIAEDIRIHPAAVGAGIEALRRGAGIVTDVRMVASGVSAGLAGRLGCRIVCAVDRASVAGRSLATGRSRTAEGIEAVAADLDGAVVAIGNAPTALLHLIDLIAADRARPAVILGLPVGFVAAAEAKEILSRRGTPYVTVLGTRGGSGMAASAVNTLLRLAAGGEGP
ncbi:MAG TPA: precorrin-8X methylmutase, partial [Dehalococcoidia bacterium]|nr:precorrin-8X methylmutase [Dehalococcoidia bacterium]